MSVRGTSEIRRACPVCGGTDSLPLCQVDGFAVWRCPASATDFVHPMPSPEMLASLYDREAWFEGGERGGYANYDAQTEPSLQLVEGLLSKLGDGAGRSVLDVGCGYGTHLRMAFDRGWKPFGVEPSAHARRVARERHGDVANIVEEIEDLVPHEFDLILMLDVVEHLVDPYPLFFRLFSKGAIGARSRIVLTTPNARSNEAIADPAGWPYRHPPSHLVYYSAESLKRLFARLRFTQVSVTGWSRVPADAVHRFPDETSSANDELTAFAGLVCEASGSDFAAFMHERYIPGTWAKIAEYEHLPRYAFALAHAQGARVLDFGCGSGYGSARLATVAASVVGLDIDEGALEWARTTHKHPRLSFIRRDDLGRGLDAGTFDLVTCFEMIEHVDHATQIEAVTSIARLLAPGGRLIISTPNPAVTVNYGENPYHLREMDEAQFLELLRPCFTEVRVLSQWIRPSVLIGTSSDARGESIDVVDSGESGVPPAAFVAICSNAFLPELRARCEFDGSTDFVADHVRTERKLNELRFERHQLAEAVANARRALETAEARIPDGQNKDEVRAQQCVQIAELTSRQEALSRELQTNQAATSRRVAAAEAAVREKDRTLRAKEEVIASQSRRMDELAAHLAAVENSRALRVARTLGQRPRSLRQVGQLARLLAGAALPKPLKRRMASLLPRQVVPTSPSAVTAPPPYVVKVPEPQTDARPRIVHAIANFCIGGSSRLVVDLVEHLGEIYEQKVLTSFVPAPPAYVGVPVRVVPSPPALDELVDYLRAQSPDLVHVHYWGDVDLPWYETVMDAAAKAGCRVLENVNTPVAPLFRPNVVHYVYVSDYVRETFGAGAAPSCTIHPGSDFKLFDCAESRTIPDDCIGMVYRLERDKLDEWAIEPFIEVARRRPGTRVLIVGGGSFLDRYREKAREAGVLAQFEFTGYVAYESLPALYSRMSVFVAPVWKESFGQVAPFAMHMGLPVAGYDVGALHEILGSRDTLAPPGNSSSLADIVVRLLDDRAERERRGRANRERAAGLYSVATMVNRYRELYAGFFAEQR